MTNVPKIQITDSGLKLPTHQEILSGVLADITRIMADEGVSIVAGRRDSRQK